MRGIGIWIDKLTNSVECVRSGRKIETAVELATLNECKQFELTFLEFDWGKELRSTNREVFKLISVEEPAVALGLISIERMSDHYYLHLIEASKFNRGRNKQYLGVAGNLFAFVCKKSIQAGFNGFVVFESKTRLVNHYIDMIGARRLTPTRLMLDDGVAKSLIFRYFGESIESQDNHNEEPDRFRPFGHI